MSDAGACSARGGRRRWWLAGVLLAVLGGALLGFALRPAPAADAPAPIRVLKQEAPILASIDAWDDATAAARHDAALAVARATTEFKFDGLKLFSADEVSREVALFSHRKTALSFVLVPAGTFIRRFPSWANVPTLEVAVKNPFLLCVSEVTWRDWDAATGEVHDRPSALAYDLSSQQALAFCAATELELPTNVQWDFACRLGRDAGIASGARRRPRVVLSGGATSRARDSMGLAGMESTVSEWVWYELDARGRDPGLDEDRLESGSTPARKLVHSTFSGAGCSTLDFGEPRSALTRVMIMGAPMGYGLRPARNIELTQSVE